MNRQYVACITDECVGEAGQRCVRLKVRSADGVGWGSRWVQVGEDAWNAPGWKKDRGGVALRLAGRKAGK